MTSKVVVRRATVGDAEAALGLRQRAIRVSAAGAYSAAACEAWASNSSLDRIRHFIESTAGFVAVAEETVVGWASIDGAKIDQLYVDPAFGGQGFARRLYEAMEQFARGQSVTALTTTASLRSEPAFARFGFSEFERKAAEYGGHAYDEVRMTKTLRSL